jgi:hypothetical protein
VTVRPASSFEPLYCEDKDSQRHSCEEQDVAASELPAELQRVVERITRAAREGAR